MSPRIPWVGVAVVVSLILVIVMFVRQRRSGYTPQQGQPISLMDLQEFSSLSDAKKNQYRTLISSGQLSNTLTTGSITAFQDNLTAFMNTILTLAPSPNALVLPPNSMSMLLLPPTFTIGIANNLFARLGTTNTLVPMQNGDTFSYDSMHQYLKHIPTGMYVSPFNTSNTTMPRSLVLTSTPTPIDIKKSITPPTGTSQLIVNMLVQGVPLNVLGTSDFVIKFKA